MLLIENGYVMDPRSGTQGKLDLLIEEGKIRRMGRKADWPDEKELTSVSEIIDAEGRIVAPGLIDVHVHFRDPGFTYKEDILTGSRAAARGGVTTVVLMANTKPAADNAETLNYILDKGRRTKIHVESCCAVTEGLQGKKLTDMAGLLEQGAAGFTDDGVPILDKELARRAMERAAELDTVLSFHEEDPAYIVNNGINAGRAAAYFKLGGSDREAEISMIRRDLRLAEETGARINIQHVSTKEGVELIRRAKAKGLDVHGEATPHHFTLTEEALIRWKALAKMNPPLREEADRQAVIEGLKDGSLDLIATDHAPHSREEKERSIGEAPSGIIGLETSLSLGITGLVKPGHLTMMELLQKMTVNPAALYRMDRGYLAEGGPADLILIDRDREYTVEGFASKSDNSPFLGARLTGLVTAAVCGGNVIYREQERG